jgi:hypothetical protein
MRRFFAAFDGDVDHRDRRPASAKAIAVLSRSDAPPVTIADLVLIIMLSPILLAK